MTDNPIILSLDIAKSTGISLYERDHIPFYDIYHVDYSNGDGQALLEFENFLTETFILSYDIDAISYEFVKHRHKSTRAAQIYWGLVAVVQLICYQYDIKEIRCPIKTVKKHISGNGNADKNLIVDSVNDRLGKYFSCAFEYKQHDIADSLAVLSYALLTEYSIKL